MEKSTFTPLYDAFRAKLIAMRKAKGFTQRQLATRLKRVWSFVEKIELGERRVDVVELYWIAKACGIPPKEVFMEVVKCLQAADKKTARSRRGQK